MRAGARTGDPWYEGLRQATDWIVSFAAPGYGPDGAHKLILREDGLPVVRKSAAGALRETGTHDGVADTYLDLARQVQTHAGDQATLALLLCGRLVQNGLRAMEDGVPSAAILVGYDLARRQARALLEASATPATPEAALAQVGRPQWIGTVVQGLTTLADDHGGRLDLDRIDIRARPHARTRWWEGIVAEEAVGPHATGAVSDGGILVSQKAPGKPRTEGLALRTTDPLHLQGLRDVEAAAHRGVVDALGRLGIRFWACRTDIAETLRGDLARAGIVTWTDVPEDSARRLLHATGATLVHGPHEAQSSDAGRGDLARIPRRQGGGWQVLGPGQGATWIVPAQTEAAKAAALDDAERLLRATGAFLADPRGVPGGGAWQRDVAEALGRAADRGPQKTPFALDAAARAFQACHDDLIRNRGGDPLDRTVVGDVVDPYPCVRTAVDAAFATAILLLRIDARHDKRPSDPAMLRGGLGPAGSPKGMPGDIPPHM